MPSLAGAIVIVPALTVVANTAPNAMKAPANMLSTNKVKGSDQILLTPLSSARAAIAAGRIASKVTSCGDLAIRESNGRLFMTIAVPPSPLTSTHR